MTSVPSVKFSAWRRWTDVSDSAWVGLNETGAYLLARFTGDVPVGAADPSTPDIFYIGESHGRTSCLRKRLGQFADSAGFSGPQKNGHYAAWSYPEEFPMDALKAAPSSGPVTSAQHVYVAVCPYAAQPTWPRDTRGAFPVYAESAAIWAYVLAQGRLPQLNNSGWQGEGPKPTMPSLRQRVKQLVVSNAKVAKNATALLEKLAEALGYKPARRTYKSTYDDWTEVERHLGGRLWLGVGWKDVAGHREFCLDLYEGDEALVRLPESNVPARTEVEVVAMLERFWNYWHQTLQI